VCDQISTGIIVALAILLNVGSRQELKARASADALAGMQVPQARRRDPAGGRPRRPAPPMSRRRR
jgi:hypothetical protein